MPEFHYTRPPLYQKQLEALFHDKRYGLVEASAKAGKAQPLDATVWTPSGPIFMGELQVGDLVLTPNGGTSPVLSIHPQGKRDIYAIEFSDGTIVEADGEHLWEVIPTCKIMPELVTTKELMSWPDRKLCRTAVPAIDPVQFDAQPVPLDPYLVGVLIGDGCLRRQSVGLSCADPEILAQITKVLPEGFYLRKERGDNCDYVITAGSGGAQQREDGTHLIGTLRWLGLWGKYSYEKSIPQQYFLNSVEVRLGLLQGLLDTDGSVNKHGQAMLEQTSEKLANDVTALVQSLGGSVLTRFRETNGYKDKSGSFVECRGVYRQVIKHPDPAKLFRLSRKLAKVKKPKKPGRRMFQSIRFSRVDEAQCIRIADPRHLYLTDGFIPTHNTVGCIVWLTEQALFHGGTGKAFWWVAPVSNQAEIAYRRLKQALPGYMWESNETKLILTMPNGSTIWFKSADKPDTLYGDDVYAAVVDEASRVKADSWYAVRSTLTATRGPIRIIGNVKGKKNWFYELARKAEVETRTNVPDRNMHYAKLIAYDAVQAGVLAVEEVEDAKKNLPEAVFRELYLAEPSDDGGNPFGLGAISSCIAPLSIAEPTCWGWDLAKSHDWTVGIALDASGQVCRFERFQKPWLETTAEIIACTGSLPALVDSTGVGDPVLEALQRTIGGTPRWNFQGFKFTSASKQQLMEGLSVAIQRREILFPDAPLPLRSELESFEFEETRTGVRYSAPLGAFDDCVCALALAWRAYRKPDQPEWLKMAHEWVPPVHIPIFAK